MIELNSTEGVVMTDEKEPTELDYDNLVQDDRNNAAKLKILSLVNRIFEPFNVKSIDGDISLSIEGSIIKSAEIVCKRCEMSNISKKIRLQCTKTNSCYYWNTSNL